jgi:death on curing protein
VTELDPGDEFDVNGHYVVTLLDAYMTHARICCAADEDPAVLMPDQLAGALARPYSGYFPELYKKAAVLMDSLAGSQVFFTGNKRTAIALVILLVRKSGYVLYTPGSKKKMTKALERLSKAVGAREMPLEQLMAWYRPRIRRSFRGPI